MTTIAYRDGVLAGDTSSWVGKMNTGHAEKKVFKLSNGSVIGFAGVVQNWTYFLNEIEKAIKSADGLVILPNLKVKQVTALLSDGNQTYLYDGGWENPFKGYWAIGHGMGYALAAMDAGASASEAIRITIKRDPFTAGRIRTVEVS